MKSLKKISYGEDSHVGVSSRLFLILLPLLSPNLGKVSRLNFAADSDFGPAAVVAAFGLHTVHAVAVRPGLAGVTRAARPG